MRKTLFALSKNLLIKVLIILIIGVFALWGVGDMFSAGKTNVVAEVYGKIFTHKNLLMSLEGNFKFRTFLTEKKL
jgi:hypothetical protein